MPSLTRKRFLALALLTAMHILLPQPALSIPLPQGQQQEECIPPPPTTKLESFSVQTGVVLIRGISRIGFIKGKGSVTVAAMELRDSDNPDLRVTGLSITVKESEASGKEKTSYVDYDELDSLLKGIDTISRADRNITRLTDFSAEYRTKGDFSVVTFSTGSGIHLAVSSGSCGKVTAHFETTDLNQLKSLIQDGKAAIDFAPQDANQK
ncbi:MAG: hypothetical protein WBL63_09785 [Candidatus Acidiferrum sp.]